MCHCQKTCLIIPCYNEEFRLDIDEFKKFCSENLIFIFVNDGSTDHTSQLLKLHEDKNWHLLDLRENRGKSEAVRQGVLYLKENSLYDNIDWFGFWDSDLSVPLAELKNFFKFAENFMPDAEGIMGSRVKRMGSNIIRSATRHYLGRVFCTVVSILLSITYYDTQCGAKIFKKNLLETGFLRSFSCNWIFDIELLLRLKHHNIIEYPLHEWKEKPGSKINFPTVVLEVIRDLAYLKRNKV